MAPEDIIPQMFRPLLGLFLITAIAVSNAQSTQSGGNIQSGYVTAIPSPDNFDANGLHFIVNSKTRRSVQVRAAGDAPAAHEAIRIGDYVEVKGAPDRKTKSILAEEITLQTWSAVQIKGFAVIDKIVSSSPEMIVRADGYRILLPLQADLNFNEPLKSIADVKTNVWIAFSGELRKDGVVVADKATFTPNVVNKHESSFREKWDKEVSLSKENAKGEIKLPFPFGKLKISSDLQLEERVNRIGQLLVPAYQRALPATDPTRIEFKFYVVDKKSLPGVWSFPGGEIFVPIQVLKRLENDDQLAAVLAFDIAKILEKQSYRVYRPASNAVVAAELASAVGGAFVPGLGLVGLAGGVGAENKVVDLLHQQSARVSLGLMQDAGFKVDQAPVAWQRLRKPKAKDPFKEPLTSEAEYLLKILALEYREASPSILIGPTRTASGLNAAAD
jgi:hypothetical protein